MKQLGMSKATLMRVLAFAMANPANPIAGDPKDEGQCLSAEAGGLDAQEAG